MLDFRNFRNYGCEWGVWEDNSYFDDPNDRSGACAYFDAWSTCSALQFRIWHIKENLHIELKGEGFNITERETKFFPDEDGEGKDTSSYCTTIVFQLTEPQGKAEVFIPTETLHQDSSSISWEKDFIYDLDGRKAHLDIKAFDHYEIKEILTDHERQSYALEDRVSKLKKIARKMNRYDILWQLDIAEIQGDFRI